MIVPERNPKNYLNHLNGFRGILAVSVLLQHATRYMSLNGDYLITLDLGNNFIKFDKY